MPFCSQNGSGGQSFNCTSSHVHLYKLHRGITSAVIQDICFSQYSQWVAIVSSKGTCHIYVLSPFGREGGLEVQDSHVDGPSLAPVLSSPWWSSSSCTISQPSLSVPPPPPITLSVVCRIRTGNSGWINTVSNAASSATGMVSVPSCAVSAVFYCLMPNGVQHGLSEANTLEHLLVYSPSGQLIQYELHPSMMGLETTDTASRTGSGSLVQIQDEDLRVKAEHLQWWDVCRRADWPEREECIKGITYGRKDPSELVVETSHGEDNSDTVGKGEDPHERCALYLSNAEVLMNYGRIPTWQNSKIHFFTLNPLALIEKQKSSDEDFGGESEIEKVPNLEIEIKRRDLLPVFEHFHNLKPDWINRGNLKHSSTTSVDPQSAQDHGFVGQMNMVKPHTGLPQSSGIKNLLKPDNSMMDISPPENSCIINSPSSLKKASPLAERSVIPKEDRSSSSNTVGSSDGSNVSSNRSDFSMNAVDEGGSSVQDPLEFGGYFQEEYCKAATLDDEMMMMMAEVVTDVDSTSSPRNKDKSEDDGENDEMLGGVFAFSEEG